jgi:hypothetical protein
MARRKRADIQLRRIEIKARRKMIRTAAPFLAQGSPKDEAKHDASWCSKEQEVYHPFWIGNGLSFSSNHLPLAESEDLKGTVSTHGRSTRHG